MLHLVIDASHIAYRAAFTLKLDAEDTPTGVLYGFLNTVLELGQRFATNSFIFAFDTASEQGVRRTTYPDYKAGRGKKDTEEDRELKRNVRMQLGLLHDTILPSLGFPNVFRVERFEADDIIASVVGVDMDPTNSKNDCGVRLPIGCKADDRFIIASTDHDLFQLLGLHGRVVMYNSASKTLYTRSDFQKEHNTTPDRWARVLAIAGCDTDEVEGLAGIGFKTAVKIVHGEPIRPVLQALYESEDGRATVSRNWPLVYLPHRDFPWDMLEIKPPEFKGKGHYFREMCEQYHFATYLREPLVSQWRAFFTGNMDVPIAPASSTATGNPVMAPRMSSVSRTSKNVTPAVQVQLLGA